MAISGYYLKNVLSVTLSSVDGRSKVSYGSLEVRMSYVMYVISRNSNLLIMRPRFCSGLVRVVSLSGFDAKSRQLQVVSSVSMI